MTIRCSLPLPHHLQPRKQNAIMETRQPPFGSAAGDDARVAVALYLSSYENWVCFVHHVSGHASIYCIDVGCVMRLCLRLCLVEVGGGAASATWSSLNRISSCVSAAAHPLFFARIVGGERLLRSPWHSLPTFPLVIVANCVDLSVRVGLPLALASASCSFFFPLWRFRTFCSWVIDDCDVLVIAGRFTRHR